MLWFLKEYLRTPGQLLSLTSRIAFTPGLNTSHPVASSSATTNRKRCYDDIKQSSPIKVSRLTLTVRDVVTSCTCSMYLYVCVAVPVYGCHSFTMYFNTFKIDSSIMLYNKRNTQQKVKVGDISKQAVDSHYIIRFTIRFSIIFCFINAVGIPAHWTHCRLQRHVSASGDEEIRVYKH